MDTVLARRLTGWSCLAAAAAFIVEVPLYFVYSGPPPDANVLSRLLIGILALGFLLIFVTGFRDFVKSVDPRYEWVGNLAFATGVAYVVVTLVSSGLEAGAVIEADQAIDPTITVSGTYILYGSIGRMLLGFFLVALGYAVTKTGALPRWTGTSAYVLALVNFAFVPSLFFGNEPSFFYAANGWGTTASMGAILSYWLLMMGIVTLRGRRGAVPLPQGARS
ncbi:hypothetical protein [Actinomadura madurae]|uniref:hypothetical protein n=1 Tax=Actinomadura madurae TaxID=1993 RepID=UPI002025C273|nr:hypothetical protein [Actinomadura madurae]MCP9951387.1 hypothetical protein [Actinomadura madurae]MCP9968161.1 hypothetical protein [Actinomadura madurae]MCP9980621.1 hypothetical protein [Actinomadura madurae]MCQ0007865.1 hypothetical protein [Actinomadura madurae]MCQ0016821.1 hypothetical protein [Actinomadura madurae]